MRLSGAALGFIFLLSICSLCLPGEDPDGSARLDALVERFCNGGVVERRAAQEALAEYGRAVWPRFRGLVNHDDPDIRRRALIVWVRIIADCGHGWAIPKAGTPYHAKSGLPMRVHDRKSGVELALLLPDRAVVDGEVHELKEALYVGVYEVTVAEYARGRSDLYYFYRPERARLPIADLTREDIAKFLKDTGLRLPSAAEWEYACRAGGVQGVVNATNKPRPISSARRNGLGLCDMIGNVAEWCTDDSLRGVSHLLPTLAIEAKPSTRGPHIGFRVVRAPLAI